MIKELHWFCTATLQQQDYTIVRIVIFPFWRGRHFPFLIADSRCLLCFTEFDKSVSWHKMVLVLTQNMQNRKNIMMVQILHVQVEGGSVEDGCTA